MLNFNLSFDDLYDPIGLQKVDAAFCLYLQATAPDHYLALMSTRQLASPRNQHQQLIIDIAIHLEDFLAQLFMITAQVDVLQQTHHAYHQLSEFKRRVIQRRILPKYQNHDWSAYHQDLFVTEMNLSDLELLRRWYQAKAQHDQCQSDHLERYMAWRCLSNDAQSMSETSPLASSLFDRPQPLKFDHLFDYVRPSDNLSTLQQPLAGIKIRRDFNLTDPGLGAFHAYDQAHYCLKCHQTNRDSCSHGLRDHNKNIQINPLGNHLHGCPLNQKISEMNVAKHQGYCLAALAIITLDNPMVAVTGYRICNDCEKACIFQKQTPVDVPSIETQILTEVLSLPWGFEIYSLLTRWNPLNFDQPCPVQATGYNVLIAGMGPAGFTLAHYMLRLGHNVLGIDALKIETLPNQWWARTDTGHVAFEAIEDIAVIYEDLETRAAYGFGGVAEYGITSRWNKNFLTVIRLILMRQPGFTLAGHTLLGSTMTLTSARKLGFDHVALCLGSGKPNMPALPHILAKGVRMASDFLMNLQASGAARDNSLADLQIRLPIIVVGGGLTAVDAATEALAYYKVQVEKFLTNYDRQCATEGQISVDIKWSHEEQEIAQEFITHGRLLRQISADYGDDTDQSKMMSTLQAWGGAQIIYRKLLQQAPAYTTNAHEIKQALAQGVRFVENTAVTDIHVNNYGAIKAVTVTQNDITKILPVHTLLLATGIEANTYYGREHPDEIDWPSLTFQIPDPMSNTNRPFIDNSVAAGYVSAFGDLDPKFRGSVVKAIASAKYGSPAINNMLHQNRPQSQQSSNLISWVQQQLQAMVVDRTTLNHRLTRLVIKAPLAAQNYQVGQFFKLQNLEKNGSITNDRQPVMKAMALTPVAIDQENGLLTFVIAASGASSRFASNLQMGDRVALMGPTGTAFEIRAHQRVLIVADDFYGLLLQPIIHALVQAGNDVHIYIPNTSDDDLSLRQLKSIFKDNHAITFHDQSSDLMPYLSQFNQIIINGHLDYLQSLQSTIRDDWRIELKKDCQILASINAPMQCMMKEICAHCIQSSTDPVTGTISYFYACSNPWQPFKIVDLHVLQGRLQQNNLVKHMNSG